VLGNMRSPAGGPQRFSAALDESNVAHVTWAPPAAGPPDSYILARFGKPPLILDGQATEARDLMNGLGCYMLVTVRLGAVAGNSDVVCAFPRAPRINAP
jgi:hypothetical protein